MNPLFPYPKTPNKESHHLRHLTSHHLRPIDIHNTTLRRETNLTPPLAAPPTVSAHRPAQHPDHLLLPRPRNKHLRRTDDDLVLAFPKVISLLDHQREKYD